MENLRTAASLHLVPDRSDRPAGGGRGLEEVPRRGGRPCLRDILQLLKILRRHLVFGVLA